MKKRVSHLPECSLSLCIPPEADRLHTHHTGSCDELEAAKILVCQCATVCHHEWQAAAARQQVQVIRKTWSGGSSLLSVVTFFVLSSSLIQFMAVKHYDKKLLTPLTQITCCIHDFFFFKLHVFFRSRPVNFPRMRPLLISTLTQLSRACIKASSSRCHKLKERFDVIKGYRNNHENTSQRSELTPIALCSSNPINPPSCQTHSWPDRQI